MKITNSKKQLAKIIHENGGWVNGAEFSAQDKDGEVFHYTTKPSIDKGSDVWRYKGCIGYGEFQAITLPNWHQTILSRDEYFHLYPVPDADGWIEWGGGECPVCIDDVVDVMQLDGHTYTARAVNFHWLLKSGSVSVAAYRLHKPDVKPEPCESVTRSIPELEAKPTIEQLAADYRNAKDYADRKQEEAKAAKAGAEAKLAELVAAGKALGLALSATDAESKPELAIINWRDLQVDDLIWYAGDAELSYGEYRVMGVENPDYEGYRTVLVNGYSGGHWIDIRAGWGFIRRPT